MSDTVATVLALILQGLPAEIAIRDVPDLPLAWVRMVDPMDPLASSVFIDVLFNDIPPYFITNTCIMESGCRRAIGIHQGDTRNKRGEQIGRRIYDRLVAHQRVDPGCSYYQPDGTVEWYDNWTTRGNHGLMYGYNRLHIGTCFPMAWFDVPLVSALAAARKSQMLCARIVAKGRKCTSRDLRIAWSQAKTRKRKRRVMRLWKSRLQNIKRSRRWAAVDWGNPPTMKDYHARAKQSSEVNKPTTP